MRARRIGVTMQFADKPVRVALGASFACRRGVRTGHQGAVQDALADVAAPAALGLGAARAVNAAVRRVVVPAHNSSAPASPA